LPADRSVFAGRESELSQLAQMLGPDGECPIVAVCVISGMAGMGQSSPARANCTWPSSQGHGKVVNCGTPTQKGPFNVSVTATVASQTAVPGSSSKTAVYNSAVDAAPTG
jgi:hypothetical protein